MNLTISEEEVRGPAAGTSNQNSTSSIQITQDQHPQCLKIDDVSSQQPSKNIIGVLKYLKSAFEDESSLDALPLEVAGNPGAWSAWRSHRRGIHANPTSLTSQNRQIERALTGNVGNHRHHAEEWSWEGVWEERVQKGIEASISDAVLYGNTGGADDLVCPEIFD
jgi:hypothetical protein